MLRRRQSYPPRTAQAILNIGSSTSSSGTRLSLAGECPFGVYRPERTTFSMQHSVVVFPFVNLSVFPMLVMSKSIRFLRIVVPMTRPTENRRPSSRKRKCRALRLQNERYHWRFVFPRSFWSFWIVFFAVVSAKCFPSEAPDGEDMHTRWNLLQERREDENMFKKPKQTLTRLVQPNVFFDRMHWGVSDADQSFFSSLLILRVNLWNGDVHDLFADLSENC